MTDGAGTGELRRELGLLDSVLFSVGGMVGSAVFFFPGATGRQVGAAAIAAWFGVGVLMLIVGTLYAELAMAFPKAGGPAVYPNETLGPWPQVRQFASYLEGVCYAFGWTFAITISALALATYLSIMFPAAGAYTVPIAVVAIALSLGVNLVGVQLTNRTNLLLAAFLLAALLVFVAAGLANAEPTNLRVGGPLRGGAFFAAMGLAMTGYGAWTAIPSAIEEIRDPERTVPRAILISIGLTTLLYTGVLAALHVVVAPERFETGSRLLQAPLGVAAAEVGLPLFGRYVLPAAAVVAIFTTMLVGTMSASRVVLAMGRSGVLPSAFARVHDRFDVPWVALVALSAAATGLALVPRYFYALEIVAALVGTALPYAINILAFLGLRFYRTELTPPFRAPAGVALAVVAFTVVALAVVGLGTQEVLWSLGAVALMSSYFLVRYARHGAAFDPGSMGRT
ncbi:MAG: APC family permease [Halobacteriales archaeon]|nr:APC family permease [Halobacteriales archaeon]